MAKASKQPKQLSSKASGLSDVVAVTVRLDRAAAVDFAEIIEKLRRAGLKDVAPHERLMMVSGTVDSGALDSLRAVPGVASVRPDQKYSAS
jgi:methylmalonyl-CoA mutase cobalamin-binding subunit